MKIFPHVTFFIDMSRRRNNWLPSEYMYSPDDVRKLINISCVLYNLSTIYTCKFMSDYSEDNYRGSTVIYRHTLIGEKKLPFVFRSAY